MIRFQPWRPATAVLPSAIRGKTAQRLAASGTEAMRPRFYSRKTGAGMVLLSWMFELHCLFSPSAADVWRY